MHDEASPVGKVLDRLEDYKERRDGFRARCPAHQGNSDDSLSIKQGEDGRALLVCHAGCDLQEIVDALGLGMVDLFAHNGSNGFSANMVTRKNAKRADYKEKVFATDELPRGTYWEFTTPT